MFLLPRTGMEILILGQGLWWFEVLAQKACRTAVHDVCQGVGLASGLGIKGMSHIYFHGIHTTMMIWKFYAKLVMHAPMWTLKHQVFMVM